MRLTRALLGAALRSPRRDVWLRVAALIGALGAIVPTGLRAQPGGAGIGGGAGWGLIAAAVAAPLIAALVAAAITGEDTESGRARELYLSGAGPGGLAGAWVTTTLLVAVGIAAVAAVSGALVGLGDSLRQGSRILTALDPATLAALPVVLWFTLLASLCAVAFRRGLAPVLITVAAAMAFLVGLMLTRDVEGLRPLVAALPLGPLWSSIYDAPGSWLALNMDVAERVVVIVAWPLGLALIARVRHARPLG